MKVTPHTDGKTQVDRISGSFNKKEKHGRIPTDALKFVAQEFVPPHILYAEAFKGQQVRLEFDDDPEDRPYFVAGPTSKLLEPGDILKIKEVF